MTQREGYLRFDALGLGPSASGSPVVMPRPDPTRAARPHGNERSEAYGSRGKPVPLRAVSTRKERDPGLSAIPLRPERDAPAQSPIRREGGRAAVRSAVRPVVYTAANRHADSLDGSSLRNRAEGGPGSVGNVKQWSGTLLRLFDTTGTGSTRHRVKFRAVVFHDGENVVRYSVFRDVDSSRGFDDGSEYTLSVHEAQILPNRGDRPAEIHVRYSGECAVTGKGAITFDGMIIIRGDGTVICTTPTVSAGAGKAAILRGAATVGWW